MEDKNKLISPSTDDELWASPIDLYSNPTGKGVGLLMSTPNVAPWKSYSSSLEDGDVSSKQQDSGYSSLTPSSSSVSFSDGELFSKRCLYCNKLYRENYEPSPPGTICNCKKKYLPRIRSSHLQYMQPISEIKSANTLFDQFEEPMDTSLYVDERVVESIPSESHGCLIGDPMEIGEEKSIDFMDNDVFLSKKTSSDSGESEAAVKEAEVDVAVDAKPENRYFNCDLWNPREKNQKTPRKLDKGNFPSVAKKVVSINRVIKKFSLNGIEKIDILYQLTSTRQNCPHIVKQIFDYLSEKDLHSVAFVSKTWNKLLRSDGPTLQRWEMYKRSMAIRKENPYEVWSQSKDDSPSWRSRDGPLGVVHMNTMQPRRSHSSSSPNHSPPVSPGSARSRSFHKAAKTLQNGERLLRCPRCRFPSYDHGSPTLHCSRSGCRHHFCVWCLCEIIVGVNHDCPPRYTPKTQRNSNYKMASVGSKICKRNLRRLTWDL